jgi:hypothetical protein
MGARLIHFEFPSFYAKHELIQIKVRLIGRSSVFLLGDLPPDRPRWK